jgi:hypothetical protein
MSTRIKWKMFDFFLIITLNGNKLVARFEEKKLFRDRIYEDDIASTWNCKKPSSSGIFHHQCTKCELV